MRGERGAAYALDVGGQGLSKYWDDIRKGKSTCGKLIASHAMWPDPVRMRAQGPRHVLRIYLDNTDGTKVSRSMVTCSIRFRSVQHGLIAAVQLLYSTMIWPSITQG